MAVAGDGDGDGDGDGQEASSISPEYGKSNAVSVRCRTQRRAARRLTQIHGLVRISGGDCVERCTR